MALTYLSSQTASSSSTLNFTSGIDGTYDAYEFHLVNLHPQTDAVAISFQVDTGTNTNYNQQITSSFFRMKLHEDDSDEEVAYIAAYDQGNGTSYQLLCNDLGNDNDQSVSGILTLYAPSDTTFVKHFQSRMIEVHESDILMDSFCAGYVNTTTALTRISFKFDSGNIDSGKITMYGVG
tara:strand:- start:616 stop:1152 length:537 start_codon:yes stop_codon:yes gene_type:complete